VVAFLGSAYMQMLPGFVAEVFDGDATMVGVLTAVIAVGSLVGSLVLASLPDRKRGRLLIASGVFLGVGLVGLSISVGPWAALPFLIVVGLGQAGRQSVANTLLQVYSDVEYRGRVMALFMTQFAMMSVGAFTIGFIASASSIEAAFLVMAAALTVVSLLTPLISKTLRTIE
jgi:MFS family permease